VAFNLPTRLNPSLGGISKRHNLENILNPRCWLFSIRGICAQGFRQRSSQWCRTAPNSDVALFLLVVHRNDANFGKSNA